MIRPDPKMPRPRSRPIRPPDDVVRRLNELSDFHRDWTRRWADQAGFHPEQHPKPGSDYNLHHVDLGAPPEAQEEFARRAAEILGLNPAR